MNDGPWPNDDTGATGPDLGPEPPPVEGVDDVADTPSGSKGVALGVAGISMSFGVLLPWLLILGIYSFLTVYAVVKAVGSAPDQPNATVVLLGIVGLTTLSVTLLAVGVWLLGRTADPKKRRR